MFAPDALTTACQDRDFRDWRGDHEHALAWVMRVEQPDAAEQLERARTHLDGLLLPRYQRQPHVTVGFAGLLGEGGYTAAHLAADVERLRSLVDGPLRLRATGWGSFPMVPFLGVECAWLHRANGVLTAGLAAEHRTQYRPHLTVGHFSVVVPIVSVLERLAPLPVSGHWQATALSLVRFDAADIAGPLTVEGELDLVRGDWSRAEGALLG